MKLMDKLRKGIAKILVALTIMWCIVGLNSDIVIAGVDDYIDWQSQASIVVATGDGKV